MARIDAKLCQSTFQTNPDISFFDAQKMFAAKFSDREFLFSLIWCVFGGAMAEWTSKAASSSNCALDRLIQRSVRQKNLGFCEIIGISKTFSPGLQVSAFHAEFNPQPHIDVDVHVDVSVDADIRADVSQR